MKKILLAITILFSINAIAQTKMSKDSLVKIMSNEVCIELTKVKDKADFNLELELGKAMLPLFTKYHSEINEVYGFTEMTAKNGQKVGGDIGVQMAENCPAFLEILSKNSDQTSELISEKTKNQIKGVLIKFNASEFSSLEVRTSSGKIEKLYWLEYFEGSNDLVKNSLKLVNKKVKVDYIEKETYKASIKEYVKVKIITGIIFE